MKIKILKGTNEIGGNTIEISTDKNCLIFDYGTPLDKKSLPAVIKKANAIILSHPHIDHYGEIIKIKDIPIYCGEVTKDLIITTLLFNQNFNNKKAKELGKKINLFEVWRVFKIGDFSITPYLIDHSATDAYMFLIEVEDKKVLYTGDFRAHGRKKVTFEKLLENDEVKNVDVIITEGTMINRNNEYQSEEEVEEEMKKIIKNGFSILISSSQNIDRIVSAYKAAKSLNKTFVVDIYTAWILEVVSRKSLNLVTIEYEGIKVYKPTYDIGGYQYGIINNNKDYFKNFRYKIFDKNNVITFDEIVKNPDNYFVKTSPIYVKKFEQIVGKKPNIIYSMWKGYIKEDEILQKIQKEYNCFYVHTSGHVTKKDLKKLIDSINPKKIIPIHTETKKEFFNLFENTLLVDDNEEILV